jgi:hypothetical protein
MCENKLKDCYLALSQYYGRTLQYVKNQTPDICLYALKRDGLVLEFVTIEQTIDMCLVAVVNNPFALEFVKNKTTEICLTAVCINGLAIRFLTEQEQTPEICMAAVKSTGSAIHFVINQTRELCLLASRKIWSLY